jgi:hypothetical protein
MSSAVYERKSCQLILNPFYRGIEVYSGVLKLSDKTFISLNLIKKKYQIDLNCLINDSSISSDYKIIESGECLVLIERKFCPVIYFGNVQIDDSQDQIIINE